MPVPEEERPPEPAPEEIGGEIAGERTRPDDCCEKHEVGMSLAGGHAADHHGQLARGDQADSGTGLEQRHQTDRGIGVGAQRGADVSRYRLEVRGVDHPAAPRKQQQHPCGAERADVARKPAEANRDQHDHYRGSGQRTGSHPAPGWRRRRRGRS